MTLAVERDVRHQKKKTFYLSHCQIFAGNRISYLCKCIFCIKDVNIFYKLNSVMLFVLKHALVYFALFFNQVQTFLILKDLHLKKENIFMNTLEGK